MELHTEAPSSDDDVYKLADVQAPAAGSLGRLAMAEVLKGGVIPARREAKHPAATIAVDPVVVDSPAAASVPPAGAAENDGGSAPDVNSCSPTASSTPSSHASPPPEPLSSARSTAAPASPPRGPRLRAKHHHRIRLRYLINAWGVSLVVHGIVLSALAFATVSSTDVVKKIINFDTALASYHSGEPELLPIYADPDNIPRDRAIGDEQATSPGEPAQVMVADGGEGEDGGGVITAASTGSGRPSSTPRVRGVGKGRISEGSSLPGVKIDGLGGSPLTLLPAAPAADLSGGGKIAGDPIFDVKEIGVALDQLAREILRHLKDHKLTVVWLFDESISMDDDKRTIYQKFDRVSSELKANVNSTRKAAGALNHAIVGFGQGIDYALEKPRDDIDLIGKAIKKLRIDSTGIENTMRAIREVVEHYAGLIRKDRQLLIVLVTDESGDDGADVEEARQALKKYKVPLYVIGRQSLFGYPFAHHRYIDPVTKDVYHPLIRRGPETADLEIYQWDGLYDRWDEQPSGFAPYELARLTRDSGGIYFVLPSEEFMRIRQREQAYSITQLKEYLPEYENRLSYVEKRNISPLREGLHAIVLEGKNFLYRREFSIVPEELVKAAFEEGVKAEAKLNVLLEVQNRLTAMRKLRDREPEKRWQAHYDLMLAQTVAFQVKAFEYRALMASIVKAPPRPSAQPSPEMVIIWVVDHSRTPLAPRIMTTKKYAEAERLLREVITRHPKTPWADLAQDTLNRGFSVQLNEWHHNPKYHDRWQYVPKY
jgi:hypothetical protein